nr:immunoglobulin light chain junction region [Macaca mulatta]
DYYCSSYADSNTYIF